ncbi:MAG: HAD family hydrolase [Candidatus Yanofskybacteria bacterium]|nr:HAD family hydrolase [Candidatus Yanofskybacteria bacterium]
MPKLFIFDLDDTLMWNEYTYSLATIEFLQYILEIFQHRAPFAGDIAQMIAETSHRLLKEKNPTTGLPYGFSINRFPDTLVQSYRTLCENGWGEYQDRHANHIHNIGMRSFDEELYLKQGMVPGAIEVINFLQDKGDILVLLTKGDPRVQERKIKALDLGHWFKEIKVVDGKTKEMFKQFTNGHSAETVYSVGNSFSSDIRPALDAGCSAIFIPCFTWRAESIDVDQLTESEKKRLFEIKNISEIVEIYNNLRG